MNTFDAAEHIRLMILDVWCDQPETVIRLFRDLISENPEVAQCLRQTLDHCYSD